MADYIARMSKTPDLPIVTYDTDGMALVYNPHGQLVRANLVDGFIAVQPAPPAKYHVGSNGLGFSYDVVEQA